MTGGVTFLRRLNGFGMQLTSFTDFGLRALMRLAAEPGRPISAGQIADEFGISRNHLTKSMARLAQAGFITTRRGGGGGAMLARPADQIRLGDVVRALDRDRPQVECMRSDGGACILNGQCLLRARLLVAREAFLAQLNESTLDDIALVPQAFGLD